MRLAYLCLQPRIPGSASGSHVAELTRALQGLGVVVDLHEVPPFDSASLSRRVLQALTTQLRLFMRRKKYDALYVRMHPLAAPAVAWGRCAGMPTAVEVNGVPEDYFIVWPRARRLSRVVLLLLRSQLKAATAVFAVTDGLVTWARSYASAVFLLPNGVDADVFRPGLARPDDVPARYALYFGALAPWQGVDLALDVTADGAWPDDLPLVIIGDGPLAGAVQRAAARRPERVKYLGARPYAQVPAYVSNAEVSLMLKDYHAPAAGQSPLKMYESLAAGTPVVATQLHGATDAAGLGDLLVTVGPRDATVVASAVSGLVTDNDARRERGVLGREAVLREHTWRQRAQSVMAVLEQASATAIRTRVHDK